MLFPLVTKLLPLVSLAATVAAAPAPAEAIDKAAGQNCESEFAQCLRLRMSTDACHETVCSKYDNKCKPCQEDALPTIFDRAATHPTSDDTAAEVQVLSDRAGARHPKNYCIVICTHAHCALLCTNPSHPPSGAIEEVEAATSSSTTDLLDLANAQPDQIGVLLEDGMTTMITSLDADGKLEGTCMWVCSGKVSCRLVCCNSAAVEAQCSLIKDAGGLPEGQAIEGTGKCEIVKKNKVVEILVCQVPEATGGGKLTAGLWDPMGVHCDVYNIGFQPIVVCHDAD